MSSLVRTISIAAFVAVALGECGSAFAQGTVGSRTASQNFRVIIPTDLAIISPDDVTLTHDETDSNQSFPAQVWLVVGNNQTGVSVSFTVSTPFTNIDDSRYQRDASLGLIVNSSTGPGSWTITQASDATDYASGDNTATVAAASNGTSRAYFNLGVNFVTDTYGSFPAGIYETTIVGTITAN